MPMIFSIRRLRGAPALAGGRCEQGCRPAFRRCWSTTRAGAGPSGRRLAGPVQLAGDRRHGLQRQDDHQGNDCAILKASFGDAVLATRGNLNNDIGLPLTLLGLNARHRAAVIEMGMNHPGEIGYLTDWRTHGGCGDERPACPP
jgi:hypothetical protein